MKSIRHTGIISVALFASGAAASAFSLTSLSLFFLSMGCISGLIFVYNIDHRASVKARKTSLQFAALRTKTDDVLVELAAHQKSVGLVYREVRALREAVSGMDSHFTKQSENHLVISLRALEVTKREIQECLDDSTAARRACHHG